VDAKGPLCTFAAAAAQVAVPDGWRITVVGAVEEESASSKGARHILAQRLPHPTEPSGKREVKAQRSNIPPPLHPPTPPTYCIIGEPSNWDRITLGYKGRLLMDVVLRIPFVHSAGEERLPAEQAIDFWHEVETLCFEFNILTDATTPFNRLDPALRHIAHREAGAFGEVELSMGFRLPLGLTPIALEQKLCGLTYTLSKGTSTDIQFSGGEMAYKGDKTNPLVRAFLKGIRAGDGTPRFVVKTGTADMNVVAPHWPETPIVAYGPGDSSLDHTPYEHIDLHEYLQAIAVLQETLSFLMKP
jgi:LysW-gamma-L-lysine carboxypeptidase